MYSIGTVLELDDNKSYAVVSALTLDNKQYIYLADINDAANIMFCEVQNDELVFVNDADLIKKLILMVTKEVNKDC